MSRSDTDSHHLVRAGNAGGVGLRHLSDAAGLNRLRIEEHRLPAGGEVNLAAPTDGEAFIYVLEGQGRLTAGGKTHAVATGDFIALAGGEAAGIHNSRTGPLKILLGTGDQGVAAAVRQQP